MKQAESPMCTKNRTRLRHRLVPVVSGYLEFDVLKAIKVYLHGTVLDPY